MAAVHAHAHLNVLAVLGAASDRLPDSAEYAALAAAWASVLESVSVDQVVGLGGPGDDRERLVRPDAAGRRGLAEASQMHLET